MAAAAATTSTTTATTTTTTTTTPPAAAAAAAATTTAAAAAAAAAAEAEAEAEAEADTAAAATLTIQNHSFAYTEAKLLMIVHTSDCKGTIKDHVGIVALTSTTRGTWGRRRYRIPTDEAKGSHAASHLALNCWKLYNSLAPYWSLWLLRAWTVNHPPQTQPYAWQPLVKHWCWLCHWTCQLTSINLMTLYHSAVNGCLGDKLGSVGAPHCSLLVSHPGRLANGNPCALGWALEQFVKPENTKPWKKRGCRLRNDRCIHLTHLRAIPENPSTSGLCSPIALVTKSRIAFKA